MMQQIDDANEGRRMRVLHRAEARATPPADAQRN